MSLRKSALCLALAAGTLGVFPAALLAQDQATAEVPNSKFRALGEITSSSVNVRSGPAESYYIAAKLQKGDQVIIAGHRFDWLKILPPEGSFSLVAKKLVDRVGNTDQGTVNADDVLVRAGSSVTDPAVTQPQTKLDRGSAVTIVGEQKDQYRIVPPEGAYLYVKKDFVNIVRTATTQETAPAPKGVVARTRATPGTGHGSQPADTATGQTTSPGQIEATEPDMARPNTGHGANDAAPQGTDTNMVEVAPQGTRSQTPARQATPAQTGADSNATREQAISRFRALEAQFAETKDKPLDQQPIQDLLQGYGALQDNTALPPADRARARSLVKYLQVRAEQQKQAKEAQELTANLSSRQAELDEQRKQIEDRIKSLGLASYTAVGKLVMSSIQKDGMALMRLVDPADGRTLVYIQPDKKAAAALGQFVGVKGEVAKDERLSVDVIEPTEIEPVDPARVMKGISARIYPASLTRDSK